MSTEAGVKFFIGCMLESFWREATARDVHLRVHWSELAWCRGRARVPMHGEKPRQLWSEFGRHTRCPFAAVVAGDVAN